MKLFFSFKWTSRCEMSYIISQVFNFLQKYYRYTPRHFFVTTLIKFYIKIIRNPFIYAENMSTVLTISNMLD